MKNAFLLAGVVVASVLASGGCAVQATSDQQDEAPAAAQDFDLKGGGGGRKNCNDPTRTYVSHDPKQCMTLKFFCASGVGFSDACGCGCIEGEQCNQVTCGAGEFCCNFSCSTCAPTGGVCTQQFCG